MSSPRGFVRGRLALPLLVLSLALTAATTGQTTSQKDSGRQEEVVRVETGLVQTDVSVVDKRGQFVEGLKPEQFELRVDGKPQAISFFESVTAGSADEESKLKAARVGAVVYTMDPRGLFHDPAVDAGRNDYPDFAQRVTGRNFFETKAVQEPLMTLAAETGGRAFINTNSLNDAFARAAREASRYYLLAWRPDTETQRAGNSRVEVVVRGRPDLRVQARRRFVNTKAPAAKPGAPAAPRTADEELRDALASLYPRRELPLALSVGFLNEPQKGLVLVASMQLDGEALGFGPGEAGGHAALDVQGVAIDDRGSFHSFKQLLTVSRAKLRETKQRLITWNQHLPLAPGLYQVRVAARDRQTGQTGSQSQWVEIPAPAPSAVLMSSIFLGELRAGADFTRQNVAVNVGRRFARHSRLRFQIFIEALPGVAAADLPLEVRVLDGGRAALTLPPGKPSRASDADPRRLAFTGEFGLEQLAAGRYVLQISAADPRTKTVVVREASFVVE